MTYYGNYKGKANKSVKELKKVITASQPNVVFCLRLKMLYNLLIVLNVFGPRSAINDS